MFRHQPHQTHPYQTTVVPRADGQFEHSNRQRSKYPWLENPPLHRSHRPQHSLPHQPHPSHQSQQWRGARSSRSSRSMRSGRSLEDGMSSPTYHTPYPDHHDRESPNEYAKPTYSVPGVCSESESSVPEGIVPAARSPAPSDIRAPGGCGGHCPGFEYVCYYVLQIIFVVGILTGISLCIAGSVLRRNNRGGDLGVLVYIGCLSFMVCSLLLGIQCCVKRSNKQRCKQIRMRNAPPDFIALDTIPNQYFADSMTAANANQASRQMRPLLFPVGPESISSTLPRNYYRNEQRHTAENTIEDVNGVPWWRR